MANINPGPAVNGQPNTVAEMTPVNTQVNSDAQGRNALRLLGVAKSVSGVSTGDAAQMNIINATSWVPVNMVTANGQVNGTASSIATLAVGLFTAAAAGGTAIKSNAALNNNSAANSAVSVATTVTAVAQTAQSVFINVGTALAGSTVDVYLYGYDLS